MQSLHVTEQSAHAITLHDTDRRYWHSTTNWLKRDAQYHLCDAMSDEQCDRNVFLQNFESILRHRSHRGELSLVQLLRRAMCITFYTAGAHDSSRTVLDCACPATMCRALCIEDSSCDSKRTFARRSSHRRIDIVHRALLLPDTDQLRWTGKFAADFMVLVKYTHL